MNKYHGILNKIISKRKRQENKKGAITLLSNQLSQQKPIDLLDLFESHAVVKKKLKEELIYLWAVIVRQKLIGKLVGLLRSDISQQLPYIL